MTNQEARVKFWKWSRTVMLIKEEQSPVPPFHRLLNQLHQMHKLKGVITTNVDGLEYKEAEMAASSGSLVQSQLLDSKSRKVLQLHGNVYTGLCIPAGCKVPLNSTLIAPLCTLVDPLPLQRHFWGIPCPACAIKPTRLPRAASSGRIYRPDMIFFHDKERLQSDDELTLMEELLGEAQGSSKPDLLVIAGSSLRVEGLLSIANSVAKTTTTIIVNPSWEPPFGRLDARLQWLQEDANSWAETILNSMDCDMDMV
jgi:NAD-dependent SIR2 family protein deacetylase